MQILKATLIAGLVLTLPIAMGGQGFVDLGDHGAVYAKKDKSDKGNNGRGSDKSKGDRGKPDRGNSDRGKSAKDTRGKNDKSFRSNASKSSGGKGPFAKLREKLGNGSSGKTERTKSAKSQGKKDKGSAVIAKKASPTLVKTSKKPEKRPSFAPKTALAGGALASQLKAMNSLNRNINGLMNSSDPKMEPFREFVRASADSEAAQSALEEARAKVGTTQSEYDLIAADLMLQDDPEAALADLDQRLIDHAGFEPVEPVKTEENAETFDELYRDWEIEHETWEQEGITLTDARDTTDQLVRETAEATDAERLATVAAEAVSEEAMRQAMIDSLNATGAGPVTEEDITPEMEAWVADQLGVDEADGLIDDYIASQPDALASEDPEGNEDPDGEEDNEDDSETTADVDEGTEAIELTAAE